MQQTGLAAAPKSTTDALKEEVHSHKQTTFFASHNSGRLSQFLLSCLIYGKFTRLIHLEVHTPDLDVTMLLDLCKMFFCCPMQARELFKVLCGRLDALSHFHFAPKPVSAMIAVL
jgi:hypothetical protein